MEEGSLKVGVWEIKLSRSSLKIKLINSTQKFKYLNKNSIKLKNNLQNLNR